MAHSEASSQVLLQSGRELAQALGFGGEPIETVEYRCSIDDVGYDVRTLEISEQLGRPYAIVLDLLTDRVEADLGSLVGGELELGVGRGPIERTFRGVVLRVEDRGGMGGRLCLRVHAGPALALLGQTRRSRIFQGHSVVEIVKQVTGEVFSTCEREIEVDKLTKTYRPLDYCVQYRETDLDFVHRLLEQAGISYYFVFDERPTAAAEVMVLFDHNKTFFEVENVDGTPEVPLLDVGEAQAVVESVQSFRFDRRVRPGRVVQGAWDYKLDPPQLLLADVESEDDGDRGREHFHEHHDDLRLVETDGHGPFEDDTRDRAERKLEALVATASIARGHGNATVFAPGRVFELVGHHDPDHDVAWALTHVVHRGDCPEAHGHESGADREARYENAFECIPLDVPYRPRRSTAKPRIHGPQTATVTGPEGEEIHVDALGRIQVLMHWDREWFLRGDETSCWLRVAQSWAGPGFGTVFLPRVGMEVVVSFIDGDPDQPICTGCVYNGHNSPPYALPDERTKSTIKTRSSPGGEGYNELRFEDHKGHEQVYLHAQRNLDEVVRAGHSMRVGADQSITVGKDRTKTVKGNEKTVVHEDRSDEVLGNALEVVAGSRNVTVMGSAVGENGVVGATLTVGGEYVVEAHARIVLRCGASQIEMTPAGINIATPLMQVTTGGTSLTMNPAQLGVVAPGQIALVGGASTINLAASAEVAGGTSATVSQGDSYLTVNGCATLSGANTTIEGKAVTMVRGPTCSVEGNTIDVAADVGVAVSGAVSAKMSGSGAFVELAGGTAKING